MEKIIYREAAVISPQKISGERNLDKISSFTGRSLSKANTLRDRVCEITFNQDSDNESKELSIEEQPGESNEWYTVHHGDKIGLLKTVASRVHAILYTYHEYV